MVRWSRIDWVELVAHLHVEGTWYDIRDEDIGDPSRPIWDPSQYSGVPVIKYAKSYHLQPKMPREGVLLLRGDN